MEHLTKDVALMIIIFWIFVPTLDQYSDIALVTRLLQGPDPDLEVSGGWKQRISFKLSLNKKFPSVLFFPFKHTYNGTLANQTTRIKNAYEMVDI